MITFFLNFLLRFAPAINWLDEVECFCVARP